MRPMPPLLLPLLALAGCAPAPAPTLEPVTLLLLGGYRDPADACRRAGESEATADYLDDAANLVACPKDAENLGVFVTETGALEVARLGGYVLYSVRRH